MSIQRRLFFFPLLFIFLTVSCYFVKNHTSLEAGSPIQPVDSVNALPSPEGLPPAVGVLPEGAAPVAPSPVDASPPATVTPEETSPEEVPATVPNPEPAPSVETIPPAGP